MQSSDPYSRADTLEPTVVLIGSFARGDNNARSDCDVLLIGEQTHPYLHLLPDIGRSPINEIKLTKEVFDKYYRMGSLLLQHAFVEGQLLLGPQEKWKELRAKFSVKESFLDELTVIHEAASLFLTPAMFGNKFLSPLCNAFGLLKNASIFHLASHSIYEFNKLACVQRATTSPTANEDAVTLLDFYDYAKKELDIALPFDPNDAREAHRLLYWVEREIRGMRDASGR